MKKSNSLVNLFFTNSVAVTNKILDCNKKIAKYGLVVTKEIAIRLVETRNEVLQTTERVEFTDGIIDVIIISFAQSRYINQENLEEMTKELLELFYYFKNETLDELDDYHLITYMIEQFDGKCYGEIDLLYKELDKLAYDIRGGNKDYKSIRDDLEGFDFELPEY